MNQAQAYFATLYPPELVSGLPAAYLSVCSQEPGSKNGAMPAVHVRVDEPEKLVRECLRLSSDQNVWNSICAHGEDLGVWRRGTRAQVTLLPGLWLDIDVKGPGHAADNLPINRDEAIEGLLIPFGLEPTMLVWSGGGLHAYWCLDKLEAVHDGNRGSLQDLSFAWQQKFIDLAEARGWHLDKTGDLTRVLRPAGTMNRKPERAPAPVELILNGGQRFSLGVLREHVGKPADPVLEALLSAKRATEAPPAPAEVWTYEATKDEVLGKMRRSRMIDRNEMLSQVLNGESFAAKGGRDHALQRLASWLAWYCPFGDIEAMADILQPSLDAMEAEAPSDFLSRDDALSKLERALSEARIYRAKQEAQLSGFRRALSRHTDSSRAADHSEGVVPQGEQVGRSTGIVLPGQSPPMEGGAVRNFGDLITRFKRAD